MSERTCESMFIGPYEMAVTIGWVHLGPGQAALQAVVTTEFDETICLLNEKETSYVLRRGVQVNPEHPYMEYAEIYHDMIN